MAIRGKGPFFSRPWLNHRTQLGITTVPVVTGLSVSSSRLPGGAAVTITGRNFRLNSDGTSPIVLFGIVPATSVVVVSPTSITAVIPAGLDLGQVDVSVSVDTQTGTLIGGFLYFAGTIQSVSPSFTLVFSGPGPQVLIRGYNLIAGATFVFGGVPATDVTFIDDTQYGVTVPQHATGYVDVVMAEPGGGSSTLRSAFHYTALTRGSDIRRSPGTVIQKQLGGSPNTAQFTVDGLSNKPYVGEEIVIRDEEDGDRSLFRGTITNVGQTYEGQIDQLAWPCIATDLTYLLNRLHPIASYTNVKADEVVRDLLFHFGGPDFFANMSFVQTNLALITVSFDGVKTLSECLDMIASMIGGGRWYVDDFRRVHFFRPPLDVSIVIPPSAGSGADFTAATLSAGGLIGSLVPFPLGYYAIRSTFLYSNGAESRLGPASNVVAFDGTKFIHIANLAIGLSPSGSITCVGRKIYYYKGSDPIASGWTVLDNTTTTLDVYPNIPDSVTVVDNSGDPVTVQDTGSSGTTQSSAAQSPDQFFVGNQIPGAGARFWFGGQQQTDGSIKSGYFVQSANSSTDGLHNTAAFPYGLYRFGISAVYSDGSETTIEQMSGDGLHAFGPLPVGGGGSVWLYADGTSFQTRGYDAWAQNPPQYPNIGNVRPISWRVYYKVFIIPTAAGAAGGGGSTFTNAQAELVVNAQSYRLMGTVPYFSTVVATGANAGTPIDPVTGSPVNTSIPIPASTDFGSQPVINPNATEQTLTWPNPDGPYLENFDLPHAINDDDMDLLHEDTGSQKFIAYEDVTQIRNRVKVFGAGTTTTALALTGDVEIQIADPTVFSASGGQVIANGNVLKFFSVSSPDLGNASLLLTEPLVFALFPGTAVQYYLQVDDIQSQRDRGNVELDVNGAKTDGVHEFVVSDPSLNTDQQLYLRAHAELAVYSKPIVTLQYATRDPNTRPGANVHVDLTDPPCHGDFLIQTVTIDQIRDEGDQLAPRYTVLATSQRFDLTLFLLSLNDGGQQVSGSAIGVVAAATTQSAAVASTSGIPIPVGSQALGKRVCWWQKADANNNATFVAVGAAALTSTGGTGVFDSDGFWGRPTNPGGLCSTDGQPFTRLELLPKMIVRMRTPPSLSSPTRLSVSLTESSSAMDTDTPSLSGQRGIYLRYSTFAGDSGWMVQCVNDAGRTLTVLMPIAVSTIYLITITVLSATQATVDVNGTSVTLTTNLPGNGALLHPELVCNHTGGNGAQYDIQSIYLESN